MQRSGALSTWGFKKKVQLVKDVEGYSLICTCMRFWSTAFCHHALAVMSKSAKFPLVKDDLVQMHLEYVNDKEAHRAPRKGPTCPPARWEGGREGEREG